MAGRYHCNGMLDSRGIQKYCVLSDAALSLLKQAYEKLGLSARGYDRMLRVSRTIADLAGSEIITDRHVGEAVQLRHLDRKYFY